MNPVESLVNEAISQGFEKDKIHIVSIGAGTYNFTDKKQSDKMNEQMFWPDPLNNVKHNEEAEQAHQWAQKLLPPDNYVRLQPVLDNTRIFGFDQCDQESFIDLTNIACNFIQDNPDIFKKIIDILL